MLDVHSLQEWEHGENRLILKNLKACQLKQTEDGKMDTVYLAVNVIVEFMIEAMKRDV